MIQVWFLFKSLETIAGLICVIYHCLGFEGREPLPHVLIYCGTFFGFTIMSLTGAIALGVGAAPPALTESFVNFVAAAFYIVAAFMSMYHAENDFHLMYLSDFEEPEHPFFGYCRAQSIAALATGALHLLHAIFACDVVFTSVIDNDSSDDSDSDGSIKSNLTIMERRPIRMYFLSKGIETKLRRYKWFDHLCRRHTPTVSLFSFLRGRKKYGSTKIHESKYEGADPSKMQPSKSFMKSKIDMPTRASTKTDKKKKTKAEKTISPYIDESPDSEEETVSNVTYSEYASKPEVYLTETDEKPTKEKERTALSPVPEEYQTRVSFSGSTSSKPSQRSSSQDVSAEKTDKPEQALSSLDTPRSSISASQTQAQIIPSPTPSAISNTPHPILKAASISSNESQRPSEKSSEIAPITSGESLLSQKMSSTDHQDLQPTASRTPLPQQPSQKSLDIAAISPSSESLPPQQKEASADEEQLQPTTSRTSQPQLSDAESVVPATASFVAEPLQSLADDNYPLSKKEDVAISVQSLPYSDTMLFVPPSRQKIDAGTSVPSLASSNEDNEFISEGQKSQYSTPTASTVSIFDGKKDESEEDGDTTPKPSKAKIEKPSQPPPKS